MCEIMSTLKECTECSEILHMWVTHQVLKHKCKRLLSVDDVMKSHNICVFQVLQQRHYGDTETGYSSNTWTLVLHMPLWIFIEKWQGQNDKLHKVSLKLQNIYFFPNEIKQLCTFATVPLKLKYVNDICYDLPALNNLIFAV